MKGVDLLGVQSIVSTGCQRWIQGPLRPALSLGVNILRMQTWRFVDMTEKFNQRSDAARSSK